MIRPQQKRAKALRERQSSLKKGDNVVTIGGMHATVNAISDNTVSLRLSEGVFVKYDKSAIANVLPKGGEKTEKKRKKKQRCGHCKSKLGLFTFTCKCSMVLCQKHLSPHNHSCSFDYMKEKKDLIEKNNPKLGEKFIRI